MRSNQGLFASFSSIPGSGPLPTIFDINDLRGSMTTICVSDELYALFDALRAEFGDVEIERMPGEHANFETLRVRGTDNPGWFEIKFAVDYAGEWHRLTRLDSPYLT